MKERTKLREFLWEYFEREDALATAMTEKNWKYVAHCSSSLWQTIDRIKYSLGLLEVQGLEYEYQETYDRT